jgi:hypothetical protein
MNPPHEVMVRELGDGTGGKLIIFNCIAYIVLPSPELGPECLIALPSLGNGGAIPLGVAESYDKALEYVQTLDKDYLLEVA